MNIPSISSIKPFRRCLRVDILSLFGKTKHKGVLALADQSIVSATNFLTGVIIGRSCTKEEFGLYMLGFSITCLALTLQTSIISTPYMVLSPRFEGIAHKKYTGSILIHQLSLSAFVVIALLIGGYFLYLGIGPRLLIPVLCALIFVVIPIMFRECIRQISFANLKYGNAFLLDLLVATIQIGGLIPFAYLGLLSASRAFWVVGIACGLVSIVWFVLNRKVFSIPSNQAISDFRKSWSFGKWVFASGLVWVLTLNLYPWFLTAFRGIASAGIWAACLGIVQIGNPVLLGVQNILGPKIAHIQAKDGNNALNQYVLKTMIFLILVTATLCLAMFFFGNQLIIMVYGKKYAGNGMIVFILAVNVLVIFTSFPSSRALFAMERAMSDFKASFVSLCFLFVIGIWLMDLFGTTGAALSLMLGNAIGLAVRYFEFSKAIRISCTTKSIK